ncbi:MAG TPA: hypothetical protein VFQ39_17360 [Longimicrobium sp.]|nr:hypothetical protein [Longimicrobium sp.]
MNAPSPTPSRQRLALESLRVETFEAQSEAAPRAYPPTANPNTWPPCCSERLVCV